MGVGFSRRWLRICEREYRVTFVGTTMGVDEIGVSVRVFRRTWIVGVDVDIDVCV